MKQNRPMNDRMPEVRTSVKRGLPYGKRDLLYTQNRPINDRMPEVGTRVIACLRYAQVSKETYSKAKETY